MFFFRFNYNDRLFYFKEKVLLDLKPSIGHYWSSPTVDSISSLALKLSESMNGIKDQFIGFFSNEAYHYNNFQDLPKYVGYKGKISPENNARSRIDHFNNLVLSPDKKLEETEQEHIYFANTIHYQALHFLFSCLDKETYSFARFIVTWQWYWLSHLLVKLHVKQDEKDQSFLNNKMLSENFRLAYNALLSLINDPVYRSAMEKMSASETIDESSLTFYETFKLSIHLDLEPFKGKNWIREIIPGPTITAFEHNFDKVKLHPKFERNPTAVIRLISDQFLPSYNFTAAFKIAALLQDTRTDRDHDDKWSVFISKFNWIPSRFFHNVTIMILSLIALLIIVTVIGTCLYDHSASWAMEDDLKTLLISAGELAILFFGVGLPVISKFRSLLVHLLLPRLVAGITVGYMAFVLQDQTYRIPNYIFENDLPWFPFLGIGLLFVACALFGYFYLYADISQFTFGNKRSVPRERALTTLAVTLLISLGLGLFACVFMTDPTKPVKSECFKNLLGPFGWFNLGILLFYMPIAIVAGLISQFIFEDKSLTAPTWNAESMM